MTSPSLTVLSFRSDFDQKSLKTGRYCSLSDSTS